MPLFSFGIRSSSSSQRTKPVKKRFQHKLTAVFTERWWRPKSRAAKNDRENTSNTRDWRSLSPDRPPLPIMPAVADRLARTTLPLPNVTHTTPPTEQIPIFQHPGIAFASSASYKYPAHLIEDRTIRPLFTIVEESDTVMSEDSVHSSQPSNKPRHQYEPALSVHLDNIPLDLFPPYNNQTTPIVSRSSSSSSNSSSSSSSSSSVASYHAPAAWPVHPKNDHPLYSAVIGDEIKCKRKFAKMIRATHRFQQDSKKIVPERMELLFDTHDNVHIMRVTVNGKSEQHKFCGNSQYIPPEVLLHNTYNSPMADIWVLGISLYRMLVGRYPFHASNDRLLLKKMMHGDFSIPSHLSEDAKDLLRRTLAPEATRASLDLVMFHPWLKPYQLEAMVPPANDENKKPIVTLPAREVQPPVPKEQAPKAPERKKKDRRRMGRALTQAFIFLIEGPYPPPKQPYHELAHLGKERAK
ncbi:uncharacterized protein BYT42DRAFT_587583 [Radiomyces spectabilis]|uniref:uncharacterized protein n=1 Tax=Radiomyces spectabilis TaxID=64574 RepID=UPI00221EBA72|nr:uncharacterized protein BYT42DRAFT_587583 [Radiomyces spectabilis]KAI8366701.1 hypothetical protein BYT42DRAFT_587583 [Radiomyces spectabilis]